MANDKKFLPGRVVQPSRDFLHRDERKGGSVKLFITDETEFRTHQEYLSSEINKIETSLDEEFTKYPEIPAVIKAKLRDDAWAKSHRPTDLFQKDTCPIIGLDNMGELLISATKAGMSRLKNRISAPTSKAQKANISAVQDISKFQEKDKLQDLSLNELISKSKRNNQTYLKVLLFDHHDPEINEDIKDKFLSWASEKKLEVEDISKLRGLSIWRLKSANEQQIKEMIQHPSIRTISYFPAYRMVLKKNLISSQKISDIPIPDANKDYPLVAVVDSGVSQNHPQLSPWVTYTISYVPEQYQDNNHGSFVAGLICMGDKLNGIGICPDEEPIKLIDIQMLPDESSPDTLSEDDLIQRLQECIPEITNKHKVRIWNMSAALNEKTKDEKFSSLAVFLDKLQDQYNIILALPSGNYEDVNQRKWPPQNGIGNADRLQVPADSVRAITVGAIACKESPDSLVKLNQPTSYSCKGPGQTYIPKPELVHYSGNLAIKNGKLTCFNQGILSFDAEGNITEDVGTSFSCPLVARTLSIIQHKLTDSTTNEMIKALAIHNSHIPEGLGTSDEVFQYAGFGKPDKVENILKCSESEITLMFEQEIFQGHNLIYPLTWPQSLKDGDKKHRGKVRMTLVAGVPLDSEFGSEYIRASISASLQTKATKNGEEVWLNKVHEDPDTSDLSKCYEKERIKGGYKWKPIKRYDADLKRITAEDWRIKVSLLLRDGFELGLRPIKFALIFTLSDPDGVAPVYNEVIVGLRNKNVITSPIQLRAQVQEKVRV